MDIRSRRSTRVRGLEEAACDSAARISQARATGRCLRAGHRHNASIPAERTSAHACTQHNEFAHGGRRISKPAMGTGDPATAHMCIDQLRGIWMMGGAVRFFWKRASEACVDSDGAQQSRTGHTGLASLFADVRSTAVCNLTRGEVMCLSHGRRSGSCRCRCVFDTPVPWRVPGGDLYVPAQQIVAHIYVLR
jgi:hypothetical protein